jgi:hypothetical protein
MSKIAVHEFITLDGVIEEPSWTMDYPFDPKMGEARLFADGGPAAKFVLAATEAYESGIVHLTYRPELIES